MLKYVVAMLFFYDIFYLKGSPGHHAYPLLHWFFLHFASFSTWAQNFDNGQPDYDSTLIYFHLLLLRSCEVASICEVSSPITSLMEIPHYKFQAPKTDLDRPLNWFWPCSRTKYCPGLPHLPGGAWFGVPVHSETIVYTFIGFLS